MTKISDHSYRTPQDLQVQPLPIRRIAIIGSCFSSSWPAVIRQEEPGCQCDFYLFNNTTLLPDKALGEGAPYDFQIVQLLLRSVLPDDLYFGSGNDQEDACERLLLQAGERLRLFLSAAMKWNRENGLLTFVANFLVPQQNPLGRLLPRYDLRNVVHFIEKLNEILVEELATYKNCHLLDVDQIASTYGRRYVQDDVVWQMNHGSALSNADFKHDGDRLEPVEKATETFGIRNLDYIRFIWAELRASYRTIRHADMVKLVVVDIDDTLWRGVAAERTSHSVDSISGWPLGLIDALGFLKRRGVMVAIVSKNDEQRITEIWDQLYKDTMPLSEFVSRKINFRTKADNFGEILAETNLLPGNVLFIDDNPVEREGILIAFPGVRVMGGNPYLWRRILLWAPETQVAHISAESAVKTDMVRAQIDREHVRKQMTRDEFLASLSLTVSLEFARDIDSPSIQRALELINKTNQFNTTGRRWTQQELGERIAAGMRVFIFRAKDRYTAYGIVGVVLVDAERIEQFVMSCRVAGMDVEVAVMAELLGMLRAEGVENISADLVATDLNLLCRDFYERCQFKLESDGLRRSTAAMPMIGHIKIAAD